VLEAVDQAEVVARLRRGGEVPVRVEPERRWRDLLHLELGGRGLSRAELGAFARELALMLGAGQDLDHALRFLVETAPSERARGIFGRLRDQVRGGGTLHGAMEREGSFPPLTVAMVRAGESGGALSETLGRLATLLERQESLVAALQTAMVYPILLVVAAVGAIVLLLTQVLPQFVPLFAQAGASLPVETQFVIGLGAFVTSYGLLLLLSLIGAGVLARRMLADPRFRTRFDGWMLRLPVVGGLSREVAAARFCRVLGTMLQNGVPLVGALAITADAVGNLVAAGVVRGAITAVKGGQRLAPFVEAAHVFPPRTSHLLRLGEETASLGVLALRAAEIHEQKSRLGLQRLVSLANPAIIIVMGGAVAFIISSLLLAMLSLNDLAQ
jgi:general secretion pathway protein F